MFILHVTLWEMTFILYLLNQSISDRLLHDAMTLRHTMHTQYSVTFQSLFYRGIINNIVFIKSESK